MVKNELFCFDFRTIGSLMDVRDKFFSFAICLASANSVKMCRDSVPLAASSN